MDIPKPGSWVKKPAARPKMPHILKPHLTARPLANNEELSTFRAQMNEQTAAAYNAYENDENGETK